jgi:hypothetical protein
MKDRYFIVYGYDDNLDFGGAHTNPYLCTVKAYNFEQAEQYAMTLPMFYSDMFGRGYITEVKIVDLTEDAK